MFLSNNIESFRLTHERDITDREIREEIKALKRILDARQAANLRRIEADRAAAGRCRHCAGPVPCPSMFGDHAVGKRRRVRL